jgi:serine/threonine protein kinase
MNHQRLHDYYMNLQPTSIRSRARYFPSITAYRVGNEVVHFEYLGYLENDPSCTAIRAQTCTKPARDIVIKFVDRYGKRAHEVLAEAGLAPRLDYCGSPQLDGGQPSYRSLYMVVMEYVDGQTLSTGKGKMDPKTVAIVRSEVRCALDLLHNNGLVFGDLRPPNVMITKAKEVKLIDFDWAGVSGQVKYPCLISSSVDWPADVKALDIIQVAHDNDMLTRLLL